MAGDLEIVLNTGSASFTVERGVPTAHAQYFVRSLVAPGGNALENRALAMAALDAISGKYAFAGLPAVDELMGRMQIVGMDASGTPGQTIDYPNVQPLGAGRLGRLPKILPGNALLVDFWIEQPADSGAAVGDQLALLVANGGETSWPVPDGVTEAATGIAKGIGASLSFPLSGLELSESGAPDDKVNCDLGSYLLAGVEEADGSARTATLDQNDGAAAALVAGEEYWASVYRDGTTALQATKGTKAVAGSAVRPAPPSNGLFLGHVKVSYQVGGTSVITTADIESTLTYYRFLVTWPATGLAATVHAGDALSDGRQQRRSTSTDVVLTPTATNEVWIDTDGSVAVTVTPSPPSPGAHWLRSLVTDGTHVTANTDRRVYIVNDSGFAPASRYGIGGADPGAWDISQISGFDPADFVRHDGSVAFTGDQSMGTHKLEDLAAPAAGADATNKTYVDGAIAAAVPKPYSQIFAGDGSTSVFTLNKTPITTDYVQADGVTLLTGQGGVLVEMGAIGGLTPKSPAIPATDADHFQIAVAGVGHEKEITPGAIIPLTQYMQVHYWSLE